MSLLLVLKKESLIIAATKKQIMKVHHPKSRENIRHRTRIPTKTRKGAISLKNLFFLALLHIL